MNPQTTTTPDTRTKWLIDPAHSLVEFSAKHMMITTVKGRFTAIAGTIFGDEAHPERSRVEVEIDTASIDTSAGQRDEHLRSGDFLDVEKFPTITFRSTRLERRRQGTPEPDEDFTLIGDLSIRGTTREVAIDVTFDGRGQDPWGGERVGFSGRTKIDRRDWGLTWNQALEAGGVLVSNDVKIVLEVQATKQQ